MLVADGRPVAHGRGEIAAAVTALWADDGSYLAGPRQVVLAGDTALVIGQDAVHVLHRGRERAWRYAIAVLGDCGNQPRVTEVAMINTISRRPDTHMLATRCPARTG